MENLPVKNAPTDLVPMVESNDIFLVPDIFAQAQRGAELLAASSLVPQQYQKNMPNCFIALATARLLDIDVFAYMQNSYVVHGRPGIEAKLKIAMINTRGPFKGPIQWRMEGEGNSRQCTAYAIHGETGELCEATVTWAMVVSEGWNKDAKTKSGFVIKSKWNTLPDLMFRYRSASFLGNLYCPEVTMGMKTIEELQDIDLHQTTNGTYVVSDITEKILKKEEASETNQEPTAAELARADADDLKKKQAEDVTSEKLEKAKAAAAKKEPGESAKEEKAQTARAKVKAKSQAMAKKKKEQEKAKAGAAAKEASEAEQGAGENTSGEIPPEGEPVIDEGEVLDGPPEDFGWV